MSNFFRLQGKGISFEEMKNYNSALSAEFDECEYDGLCCADSVSALRDYIEPLASEQDHEIVVFRGKQTSEIYDGVVAKPLEEITRISVKDFMASDEFLDLEEW